MPSPKATKQKIRQHQHNNAALLGQALACYQAAPAQYSTQLASSTQATSEHLLLLATSQCWQLMLLSLLRDTSGCFPNKLLSSCMAGTRSRSTVQLDDQSSRAALIYASPSTTCSCERQQLTRLLPCLATPSATHPCSQMRMRIRLLQVSLPLCAKASP
jgi:hypothetical protein